MNRLQLNCWFLFGLVFVISHVAAIDQVKALEDGVLIAQIVPDETLGNEGSIVIDDDGNDFISGGATRGANLFHSFQDFNVNTGQQVYFVNPEGIKTILSRVTGSNKSDIDGLLGVDGTADLFLLNPNGITFGPSAELDIRGAFTASTAGMVEFTDGSTFSAVNPQGASLTMSVPLGVQFGGVPQGDIASTGVLKTGQELTLSGNQLYFEGQLIAGDNLTLQAQDTVTIRDRATDAFIAHSGDDLTIQGNQGIDIWTLQHLEQTPFVSGGDLILISDGEISGDAHFESGDSLQFLTLAGTPGNFVSFHDPIIFADGDVVFGNYGGVSLKVEATGSIQTGGISISGPDTTLIADGSGSDEDLLASGRTLILRAGVDTLDSPSNIPQTTEGTMFNLDTKAQQQPSGSIVTGGISIIDNINSGNENSGTIILDAVGNIVLPFTLLRLVNGGNISITSQLGDIGLGDLITSLGNTANGWDISIQSESGNIEGNRILSRSFDNDGGGLIISTISGDIKTSLIDTSSNDGNGGNVNISSTSGNITINNTLYSNSLSVDLGSSLNFKGGDISINSDSGNIKTGLLNASSSSGNGGDISISSNSGDIATGDLSSNTLSMGGQVTLILRNVENGGDISISSISGDIMTGDLDSYSASGSAAADGGDISISSISGDITIGSIDSFSFSTSSTAGNGGDVSLFTENGIIAGNDTRVIAVSIAPQEGEARKGGEITLGANTVSGIEIFTLSNAGKSGDVIIQGVGNSLMVNDLRLITSAQLDIPNPLGNIGGVGNATIPTDLENIGESGNTIITSDGDLTLNNVEILSDAKQASNAGDVEIISAGEIQLNNSRILSNTNVGSTGNGGNVVLIGAGSIALNNTPLNTDTLGEGRAGSISISTPLLNLQNNTRISGETSSPVSSGVGGTVEIEANRINLSDRDTAISVNTNGPAVAGNIFLQPNSSGRIEINTIGNGPQISASTAVRSTGDGGNISILDAELALLRNTELITSGNGSGSAGNIIVQDVDLLLMRQGSLILAESSATGGGGNVDIDAEFVFTIPEEDNDILANALFGQGGTIDITANLITGFRKVEQFTPNLRGNRISDLSARSNFGLDGIVRLDADPTPELTELPTDLVDPANRIAQGCRAEDFTLNDRPPGDFIITGRGGQLLEPTDIASEDAPLDDLGPDIIQPESSKKPDTESSLLTAPNWSQLTDAQEAVVTESGEVFLVADTAWRSFVSCAALHPPS